MKSSSEPLLAEHQNSIKPRPIQEDWTAKPLHGRYHKDISEVADLTTSYQWITKSGFRDNTEALIMAAQEQALRTRYIEARLYGTRQDARCRLCKEQDETIMHIISGCKILAGKAYLERHNQVANILHRNISKEFGFDVSANWWDLPEKVCENEKVKILWDFYLQTDRKVLANKPDIVVVNKQDRQAWIIDVAIPFDRNIKDKEWEKIDKYQPLSEELKRTWKLRNVQIIPVVIGGLGAVTPMIETWLENIPGHHDLILLQKSALLGSAKIIRRTLNLPGLW